MMVKIRVGKLKLLEDIKDIPPEAYQSMRKFYNELDYWIVYYGMRDFIEEEFTIDDVKKMHHVHDIAQKIVSMSSAPEDIVEKIVRSNDGKLLATCHYQLHVPLTDAAWKITPLQFDFLFTSKLPENVADTWEEFLEKERTGVIHSVTKP